MRFLKGISIKKFLMGIVSLLAIILTAVTANNALNSYRESSEITRINKANNLSDDILAATGFEAKERGMSAMALAAQGSVDTALLGKIQDARLKGDEAFKKALIVGQALIETDKTNTVLEPAIKKATEAHLELESARKEVDRNINMSGARSYDSVEWSKLITSVIDADTEFRQAVFSSNASRSTHQEALKMNLDVKQAVWAISEYSGRQRALIAPFVNSGKPMDPVIIAKVESFKTIVNMYLGSIKRLKDSYGVDPAVAGSIATMDEVYAKNFVEIRNAVMAAASSGQYPVSGKEWIEKSTAGIDSVLNVSAEVGKMVGQRLSTDARASKRNTAFSAALLVFVVVLCVISLLVIKQKVCKPMHYLQDKMTAIENTGDLTMQINVESKDENGQMASTFNAMIGKFNEIIGHIRTSIEILASSSEELSASATQIAEGSKSQSARATQVSTAAQEMSATIIEVAKNVSSASDAAREASAVAVKGGDIVTQTIDSMNGIADTAKASSVIISQLGGRSQEIGNIINVIEDIADQTNLLALNAAIEAARAGEQGRGFAVVADEVRKLAEKTMKATKEIGDMIKAMQDETGKAISSMEKEVLAVESGAKLAEEAGYALKDIVSKVDVVTSMVHQIATASEEQSAATEQISGDIESVANVINETTASAQQIAAASHDIAELASRLKDTVAVFKISEGAARAEEPPKKDTGKVLRLERPTLAVNVS